MNVTQRTNKHCTLSFPQSIKNIFFLMYGVKKEEEKLYMDVGIFNTVSYFSLKCFSITRRTPSSSPHIYSHFQPCRKGAM